MAAKHKPTLSRSSPDPSNPGDFAAGSRLHGASQNRSEPGWRLAWSRSFGCAPGKSPHPGWRGLTGTRALKACAMRCVATETEAREPGLRRPVEGPRRPKRPPPELGTLAGVVEAAAAREAKGVRCCRRQPVTLHPQAARRGTLGTAPSICWKKGAAPVAQRSPEGTT